MKISLLLLSFIFRYMKEQNKSHKSERKGKLTFLLTSLCSACTFLCHVREATNVKVCGKKKQKWNRHEENLTKIYSNISLEGEEEVKRCSERRMRMNFWGCMNLIFLMFNKVSRIFGQLLITFVGCRRLIK